MIKKLDIMKDTRNVIDKGGIVHTVANFTAIEKINELVDAVNALVYEHDKDSDWYDGQTRAENVQPDAESRLENVQKETFVSIDEALKMGKKVDPYAEQRKWIRKLCRFWDDDAFITSNDWAFGILTSIDKGMQYQFCCNENCNFKHCEPILPTDNAIYKGE